MNPRKLRAYRTPKINCKITSVADCEKRTSEPYRPPTNASHDPTPIFLQEARKQGTQTSVKLQRRSKLPKWGQAVSTQYPFGKAFHSECDVRARRRGRRQRASLTLLVIKISTFVQFEIEVVLAARRVAVVGIDFHGVLLIIVENETTSADTSRALMSAYIVSFENSYLKGCLGKTFT